MPNRTGACTIGSDDEARCAKEGTSPLHQTPKPEEVQKNLSTVSVIHDIKVVKKKLPRQQKHAKTVRKEIAKRPVKEGASVRKNKIHTKGKKRVSPLITAVEKIKLKSREIRNSWWNLLTINLAAAAGS
jgi:hypothetical protein